MKILHLGDLHIGKKVNGYSMIEDQKYIFQQMYNLIKEKEIETVIIAGDIYDRTIPPEEGVDLFNELLDTLINDLKVKVIAVSGNHDSSTRLDFSSKILSKQGLYIQGEYKKLVNKISIEEVDFYLMPYVTPSYIRNRYSQEIERDEVKISTYDDVMGYITGEISKELDSSRINIGVYHGFVVGSGENPDEICKEDSVRVLSVGGKESVSSKYFDIFDYTALGHLHGNRKVSKENIRYSGSPLKYSFSEEKQEKVFQLIEIIKNTEDLDSEIGLDRKIDIKLETVKITPKYEMYTLKGTIEEVLKRDIPRDSYVKIILTEMVQEAMSRLKERYSQIMELTFELESGIGEKGEVQLKEVDKISKDELFKIFAKESGIEFSNSELEKVQELMNKVEGL